MTEQNNRMEDLVIQAIVWADEISSDTCSDLLRAMGITSEELSHLGFSKISYPNMHKAITE